MDGKDAERGVYRRFRSDSGEGKTVVPLVSTDKMAINRSPPLEGSKGRSQMFGLADDANWEADLQDSIDWQFIRTKLANERTFLAWVRTSLTLFSFGYGILKVESYLSPDSVRCQCRQLMATPCRSRTHTHTPRPREAPSPFPYAAWHWFWLYSLLVFCSHARPCRQGHVTKRCHCRSRPNAHMWLTAARFDR